MNKLEEIISKTDFENTCSANFAKQVAIEFGDYLSNEIANNVEILLWQNTKELEIVGDRAEYLVNVIKIKEFITDVIKQYKNE